MAEIKSSVSTIFFNEKDLNFINQKCKSHVNLTFKVKSIQYDPVGIFHIKEVLNSYD